MTLADELRGVTPRITCPGRVIVRDDPQPYVSDAMRKTDGWMEAQDTFTLYDLCDALFLTSAQGSAQMRRWKKHNKIVCVGEANVPGVRMCLWRPA
jgi:hypothetical protein